MSQTYDLIVIGTGPGGYVAAIRAAQLGLKVAAVEKENTGGVCLNWGCIPTKSLIESAHFYEKAKRAKDFGLNFGDVSFDFQAIIKRSRQIAGRLEKGIGFLLKKNKIDLFEGEAEVLEPGKIIVRNTVGAVRALVPLRGEQPLQAKNILIATGARPKTIPGIEPNGTTIITSREAIQLEQRPEHLAILGAGVIGLELGYFYASLGTKVSVFEMEPNIMPLADAEVSQTLEKIFKKEGWNIFTASQVQKVVSGPKGVTLTYQTADGQSGEMNADKLLSAVGMRGNGDKVGPAVPFDAKNGFIKVNEFYESSVKGIYAIGDVIGPPLLAHTASAEGLIAAEKIAGKNPHPLNYNQVPSCVYTEPQIASVGLTEKQALDQGKKIRIGRFPFQVSGRALASGESAGFVKVILEEGTGEILGTHMLGAGVTELIAEATLAMHLEATGETLHHTIHSHPTLSEALMEAAADASKTAIHL